MERHLLDMSYTASLAGLDFSLDITIDAILITAKGFSQKLPLFLHNMMEEIVSFSVDVENFDIVHHRLMQDFKNFRKLAPYYHSSFYAEFCLWEYGFSNEDMLIALPGIDYIRICLKLFNTFMLAVDFESIKGIKEYYFKNISCESFIFGNIVEREALFLVKQLGKLIFAEVHTRHSLSPELLPSNHRLVLRPPTNLVLLRRVDNTNSAITMCIQVSELTNYKGLLFTMLFVQFYGQLFFDQLRTKEQLGYIVYLIMTKTSFTVDLKFTIQSAAQGPSYLYRSIQSFLSSLEVSLFMLQNFFFCALFLTY